MATSRDPKREAFWRRALRRQAKGGTTIVEFCENEGLTESTFHYWRRRIQQLDAEPQSQTSQSSPPTLVPVQLVEDGSPIAPVEIAAGNGLVIRVSESATTDHIRRVLQAVGELD